MAFSEANPKPLVACWASARVGNTEVTGSSFGSVPRNALVVVNRPTPRLLAVRKLTGHPNHLGHESLDVTLAYLKGKDAESEEAQEHANSSSLALYA
jgi:hypothetical protein